MHEGVGRWWAGDVDRLFTCGMMVFRRGVGGAMIVMSLRHLGERALVGHWHGIR